MGGEGMVMLLYIYFYIDKHSERSEHGALCVGSYLTDPPSPAICVLTCRQGEAVDIVPTSGRGQPTSVDSRR